MSCRYKETKKGVGVLRLAGGSGWAGKPVVNTVVVDMRKTPNWRKIKVDRGMLASLRVKGSKKRTVVHFGSQAGTITKRTKSVIKFHPNSKGNKFIFENTTASHGPFNHMQRIEIQGFKAGDKIELRNIGKTYELSDLQKQGGFYVVPGVHELKLKVFT